MARLSAQSVQHHPLTLVLGTDANVRVLREPSRPGGLLGPPLIAARGGFARASVWSALETLEEVGIVSAEGTGNARLSCINERHPLAARSARSSTPRRRTVPESERPSPRPARLFGA